MFDLIENLRAKSDKTKRLIAFSVALFSAGFIFVIWLTVVWPSVKQQKEVDDRAASTEPSPFATFADIISQGSSAVVGQLDALRSAGSAIISPDSGHFVATSTASTTEPTTSPDDAETP